jgi:hypothetical protein
MIANGKFKSDEPQPGSNLARREALEEEHGVVFKPLGGEGGYQWVAHWTDPDSGMRKKSKPMQGSTLIQRLEDLFAGTSEDVSWFSDDPKAGSNGGA